MPKKKPKAKAEYIDVQTLATRWDMGVQTVYDKIERKEIPTIGVRPYRIPLAWVRKVEAAADLVRPPEK